MTDLDKHLAEIKARETAAHSHICDLSSGTKRWVMCSPVQPADSDVILQAPLDDIPRLVKALEKAIEQRNGWLKHFGVQEQEDKELLEILNNG